LFGLISLIQGTSSARRRGERRRSFSEADGSGNFSVGSMADPVATRVPPAPPLAAAAASRWQPLDSGHPASRARRRWRAQNCQHAVPETHM